MTSECILSAQLFFLYRVCIFHPLDFLSLRGVNFSKLWNSRVKIRVCFSLFETGLREGLMFLLFHSC